jgi:hypothetical protein
MQSLREKWGQLVFAFLDRLPIRSAEKMTIIEAWLSDAVVSKEVEFIGHCLQYVHPNVAVNYFIEALEKNDDLLANAFVPILHSLKLGELSRNDLNLLLFSKKKYDWLKNQFGCSYELTHLIEWCCNADANGLKKSGLKNLLDEHFIDHQTLSLSIDLHRFCYHLSVLEGDELTAEDRIALHAIVQTPACNDRCFEERLLCEIILAQLTISAPLVPKNAEKIKQKYLDAVVTDYPSELQKNMIKKIQCQCCNQMNEEMLAAYRALKFAILSVSLSADDELGQFYKVIRQWKNADSIMPGKTHCQLLAEHDNALQSAASSRSRSTFSFFCCSCDKDDVFSHEVFVNSLPIVAINVLASRKEQREPFSFHDASNF